MPYTLNPFLIVMLVGCTTLAACTTPVPTLSAGAPVATSEALDTARVARVLQGLRPRIEIAGRPVRWTIEERMAHHGVPGVSIAVIDGGRIAWARGFGVREAGQADPVTPSTLFQAGSISKPLTATAMLRLVEQGAVDLDTDVNRYLTSWRVPETPLTATEKVTLRRIASHNAGLTVHGFRGYASGEPVPTVAQVLDGESPANNAPIVVDAVPGSVWQYSGGGYTVMQQLLSDVTGEPFPELMRRLVLEPVGMDRSAFVQPLPPPLAGGAARGHADGGVVPGGWHVLPELAAAGLWTTPTDLATWAVDIADAYLGRPSPLLTKDMARQMLTPMHENFGLGLSVRGTGRAFSFNHTGANVGFRAMLGVFPEAGVGMVIMTNGENGGALAGEIVRALAAEYEWPALAPETVTAAALDEAEAAGLVGNYTLRVGPGRPVEVRMEGGRLVLHGPLDLVQELVPESDTRFVTPEMGWRVEFERGASGRATGLRVFHDASGPPIEGVPAGEDDAAAGEGSPADANAAPYVGTYVLQVGPQTRELRVVTGAGGLAAELAGQGTSELVPDGEHAFSMTAVPGGRLVFDVEGDLAVRVTLHIGGRTLSGARTP